MKKGGARLLINISFLSENKGDGRGGGVTPANVLNSAGAQNLSSGGGRLVQTSQRALAIGSSSAAVDDSWLLPNTHTHTRTDERRIWVSRYNLCLNLFQLLFMCYWLHYKTHDVPSVPPSCSTVFLSLAWDNMLCIFVAVVVFFVCFFRRRWRMLRWWARHAPKPSTTMDFQGRRWNDCVEENCLPEDESTKHSQDALPHHSCAAAFIFKCCVFVFCMKYIMSRVVATDDTSSVLDIVWLLQISFGAGQYICQMILKKVNWNK